MKTKWIVALLATAFSGAAVAASDMTLDTVGSDVRLLDGVQINSELSTQFDQRSEQAEPARPEFGASPGEEADHLQIAGFELGFG